MWKERCLVREKKSACYFLTFFACLENEEKKKKKPRNLEAFKIEIFHQPHRAPPIKTTHGTVRLLQPW